MPILNKSIDIVSFGVKHILKLRRLTRFTVGLNALKLLFQKICYLCKVFQCIFETFW